MFRGKEFVRHLISNNIKEVEFIYKVNFEAGKGLMYIYLHWPLNQSFLTIERNSIISYSEISDRRVQSSPTKVELFIELIGQVKVILDSKIVGSASSVTEESYNEWNEVLCKIIILASFAKINQA